MKYLYTLRNQLEEPHNYMYAKFQGSDFIEHYKSDRLSKLSLLSNKMQNCGLSSELISPVRELAPYSFDKKLSIYSINDANATVQKMTENGRFGIKFVAMNNSSVIDLIDRKQSGRIYSFALLNRLLHDSLKSSADEKKTNFWINRFRHQFEVTKKIFEYYSPGLVKGGGATDLIYNYVLVSFFLAVTLEYQGSLSLKRLSCLLKVNDLIGSVSTQLLEEPVLMQIFGLSLALELSKSTQLVGGSGD